MRESSIQVRCAEWPCDPRLAVAETMAAGVEDGVG